MDTPDSLAARLLAASAGALVGARAVVEKGALNVKNGAKLNVQQSAPRHNAGAHKAITYDVDAQPTAVEAEIGYDKDQRGGSLGNLLEYGGGGDHSPPHRDIGRAREAEEPRLVSAIEAMARKLL